jgi:hypothetical protein
VRKQDERRVSCLIETGSLRLTVDCGGPASFAAVREHLAPWSDPPPGSPRASRELFLRVREEGTGFVVDDGASPPTTARDVRDLLYFLQRLMDSEVTRLADYTPIHAGVVEVDGRAVLLPGGSGTGKTTLVAALVARGARYLSDEYALIDDRGWVHAYPRPLPPSVAGRSSSTPEGGRGRLAARQVGARQVGYILSLRFVEGGELDWRRVAASEAALVLLRNTPRLLGGSDAPTARILRAVAHARAFEGSRGEAATAAPVILAMVREASGQAVRARTRRVAAT